MSKKITAVIFVIAGAGVALLAGPRGPLGQVWRPIAIDPRPAGLQLGGLMVASMAEAIGFGMAVAVIAVGRPLFASFTSRRSRTTAAQLAAAWLLGSWWPHSALHLHYGLKASALVGIELAFHGGSIVAAAVLLWALAPRRTSAPTHPVARATSEMDGIETATR